MAPSDWETSLRLLTPKVIEDWRDERLSAGAGATSVRKVMVVMQSLLERAKRDKKVDGNAAREVKKPSGKREGSVAVLPPEKVQKIRAKLDAEGKAIVSVLAYAAFDRASFYRSAGQTLASKRFASSRAQTRTGARRKPTPARTAT